jgi:hypothetical protein
VTRDDFNDGVSMVCTAAAAACAGAFIDSWFHPDQATRYGELAGTIAFAAVAIRYGWHDED